MESSEKWSVGDEIQSRVNDGKPDYRGGAPLGKCSLCHYAGMALIKESSATGVPMHHHVGIHPSCSSGPFNIVDAAGVSLFICTEEPCDCEGEHGIATLWQARLIAAAPELYQAAKQVLKDHRKHSEACNLWTTTPANLAGCGCDTCNLLAPAIQKAEEGQ